MQNLFYEPNINKNQKIANINSNEAYHIIKVLRHRNGDKLYFTDGKGGKYLTELISADTKNCVVKIIEHSYSPPPETELYVAIAPPKKIDRFEFFVEKAVETGISGFFPIITRFSERKKLNIDRIDKIIISAMKQSLRLHKPRVNPIISFNDFIKKEFTGFSKYIALCNAQNNIKNINIGKKNIILIGPEGGFDNTEINKAIENGFNPLLLSKARLRTETAALLSVFAFNFSNSAIK